MGWLNRKLSEIKELREIEKQAYEEEQAIVETENKKYRKQQAIKTGKEKAQKKLNANKYNKKVERAIERGKKKARVTEDNDNSNDMETKIKDMWGL